MSAARLFFIGLGLALLAPFAYCLTTKLWFWSQASTAPATVVALEIKGAADLRSRKPTLFPVVRFVTAQGQHLTATAPTGTNPPAYEAGQRVSIRYLPDNPQQVEMPDFFSRWGGILISAVFGLLGWAILRAAWAPEAPGCRTGPQIKPS